MIEDGQLSKPLPYVPESRILTAARPGERSHLLLWNTRWDSDELDYIVLGSFGEEGDRPTSLVYTAVASDHLDGSAAEWAALNVPAQVLVSIVGPRRPDVAVTELARRARSFEPPWSQGTISVGGTAQQVAVFAWATGRIVVASNQDFAIFDSMPNSKLELSEVWGSSLPS